LDVVLHLGEASLNGVQCRADCFGTHCRHTSYSLKSVVRVDCGQFSSKLKQKVRLIQRTVPVYSNR
jgi:hypothetical protein